MSNSCPSVMNQMDFFSSETSSSFKVLNSMEKFVISTPKSHPLLFSSVNVFIFSTAEQPGYTMKSPQLIFEIAVLLPSMNVFYLSYTLLDVVLLSGKHLPFGATFATNVVTNLISLKTHHGLSLMLYKHLKLLVLTPFLLHPNLHHLFKPS
jgi:hypothetical protein